MYSLPQSPQGTYGQTILLESTVFSATLKMNVYFKSLSLDGGKVCGSTRSQSNSYQTISIKYNDEQAQGNRQLDKQKCFPGKVFLFPP